jgi:hypothetical protein
MAYRASSAIHSDVTLHVWLVHLVLVLLLAALIVAVLAWLLTHLVAVFWFVVGLARLFVSPPAVRRYYPAALWASIRWRWLTRRLGLARPDPQSKLKFRGAIGPSIGRNVRIERPKIRYRYPCAVIVPDDHGIVAWVRTIPGIGRTEFEAQAEHIANAWLCVRVQITQPRPGRLIVRGLRRDPLMTPLELADTPAASWPGSYPELELVDAQDEDHGAA